jgi:hypothetical protein
MLEKRVKILLECDGRAVIEEEMTERLLWCTSNSQIGALVAYRQQTMTMMSSHRQFVHPAIDMLGSYSCLVQATCKLGLRLRDH